MGEPPRSQAIASAGLRPFSSLLMALRFYSRIPTGDGSHERPDLNRIARVLPFASLLIDLLPALVLIAAILGGMPALFSVVLAIAASAIVTGAMSEDAAADAADGLFGGMTPPRRLEIMRDSRHGTYGVLTIVLLVGLKAAALFPVAARDPFAAALLWVSASMIARSASLWLPLALPPARTDGAAAAAGGVSRNAFVIGLVLAVIIAYLCTAAFIDFFAVLIGLGVCGFLGWAWRGVVRRRVGGVTGDLIGALQAGLEVALLAVFMRAFLG